MQLALVELTDRHDPRDLPPEIVETSCVYMYDTEQYTYCCELTPSHWLEPLYRNVSFQDDISDERREELLEDWGFVTAEDAHYQHASRVKPAHLADHSKDDPDETPQEVWNSWRESWQGNCPL